MNQNTNMYQTGWKKEPLKFKDYSAHKHFGSAEGIDPKELIHDITGVPVVFQGNQNSCVSCSVTWIEQWLESEHPNLAWEFLAEESNTDNTGAAPSQVLEPARNTGICIRDFWKDEIDFVTKELNAANHKIGGYAFLTKFNAASLYQALLNGPVMVGVDDYRGQGAHMMVCYGLKADLKTLKVISWWNPKEPDLVEIPISDVTFACSILKEKPEVRPTADVSEVLSSKINHLVQSLFVKNANLLKVVAVAVALVGSSVYGLAVQTNKLLQEKQDTKFGSAGVYNTYSPSVAGAGISSTDTYLPVSSFALTDGSGISISTSTIHLPAYFIVNPKSTTNRETMECHTLDTANATFRNCSRAISCNNLTGTTSTVSGGAYSHSAGEPVIMSNDNCFYQRFVDDFTTQSVGGTKTFTTSTVSVGDNTTSSAKSVIFRVGLGDNTYFKFVGPPVGNTTATAYFNVGSGDLQLNASGTTVGASSTSGLYLTNGFLGINASGTNGLNFLSDGSLAVKTSSTNSTNGGFIQVSTSTSAFGRLLWDVRSFLAGAWTWTGAHIFSSTVAFNGGVTSTAGFTVNSPTSTRDAANKGYVDNSIFFGIATGTTGISVTAGQALYISTTSTLFQTNTNIASSTYQFVGFAMETGASGATIKYSRPGGINCNQSGLSAGYNYYLNGTTGQISTTPGTKFARIGRALSSSCIQLLDPKYIEKGSFTVTSGGDATTTIGFYPALITIRASATASGISIGDDSNTSVYACLLSASNTGAPDASNAWHVADCNTNATGSNGTVSSKTATGFIVTATGFKSNTTIQYTAYSE